MTAAEREPTGALFVDLGDGREIKHGDRAGQIAWKRQPRAKYECLLCRTTEGPVSGPIDVRQFVATIRDRHKTTCRPITTSERQAA